MEMSINKPEREKVHVSQSREGSRKQRIDERPATAIRNALRFGVGEMGYQTTIRSEDRLTTVTATLSPHVFKGGLLRRKATQEFGFE